MKIELLRSTIDCNGGVTNRQHLTCFVINDSVAVDAGSLAQSCSERQRQNVRDIVLTHAHLDHIAGLPLFIDDLFSTLDSPIRIHACEDVIEVLERHIFNWSVYPRFSELKNSRGPVVEYERLVTGMESRVRDLTFLPVRVNHKVPGSGFLISDENSCIGFSGDTSVMDEFWSAVNRCERLSALLIECAFPSGLQELADVSHHLTPQKLRTELEKFGHQDTPVYVINMKPMFRDQIVREVEALQMKNLNVFDAGRPYEF